LLKDRKWPINICANLYFSNNKSFSTEEDYLVDSDCESFSKRKKKGKIYFKDLDLRDKVEENKNYYLFVNYSYNGQSYTSDSKKRKQYVKINVIEEPELFNGNFEEATCNNLRGWTFYKNSPNETMEIHIYADDNIILIDPANILRKDLYSVYGENINPNHGFNLETPDILKDGNSHTIQAYAVNPVTGEYQELNNSPRTISNCYSNGYEPEPEDPEEPVVVEQEPTEPDNHLPEGWVDRATCTIKGWTRDADTTKPIWIHVYIDNSYAGASKADLLRTDLPFGDKKHGFSFNIPNKYRNGKHKFNVFGMNNIENSSRNPELNYTSSITEEGGKHYFECF